MWQCVTRVTHTQVVAFCGFCVGSCRVRSASFVLPASSFLPGPGTWCRARYGSGTYCAYLLFFSDRDALTLTYRYSPSFSPCSSSSFFSLLLSVCVFSRWHDAGSLGRDVESSSRRLFLVVADPELARRIPCGSLSATVLVSS